ncbi:type VI secretion system accessory protein TagJ [Undibacterium sp.]|uniref:type VI secretion system accessory protein TagJ n=1 Tax=Undibacterium sp. TaxID=1914977 RepID=UPI00374D6B0C
MSAVESLKSGNLQEALQSLQQEVRQHPADAKRRVFLFQLLVVLGQWERAMTQLTVIGDLDANAMPMVHAYREAVRCEVLRQEIFEGKRSPVVFGDPEPWVAQLLEALRLGATGDFHNSQIAREQAFAAAPGVSGTIDDQPFEWIADADPRLGPVFELIANGKYYWIPMHRISSLRIEAPADLRDNVWMPVGVNLVNGGELVGFIPTRYPLPSVPGTAVDNSLLLARRTDWSEPAPGLFWGSGQRMFATDEADYPLMEIRSITFAHPPAEAALDTVDAADAAEDPAA